MRKGGTLEFWNNGWAHRAVFAKRYLSNVSHIETPTGKVDSLRSFDAQKAFLERIAPELGVKEVSASIFALICCFLQNLELFEAFRLGQNLTQRDYRKRREALISASSQSGEGVVGAVSECLVD